MSVICRINLSHQSPHKGLIIASLEQLSKKVTTSKATSKHSTQKEAEDAAREMLKNQGGGELITKGRDGKIRSKDTIALGKDSNPPKDKEH